MPRRPALALRLVATLLALLLPTFAFARATVVLCSMPAPAPKLRCHSTPGHDHGGKSHACCGRGQRLHSGCQCPKASPFASLFSDSVVTPSAPAPARLDAFSQPWQSSRVERALPIAPPDPPPPR